MRYSDHKFVFVWKYEKECSRGDDADMSVGKRLNDIAPPNVVVEQRNLPVFRLCDVERGGGEILLLSDRGKSLPAVDSIVLFWATNTTRFVD